MPEYIESTVSQTLAEKWIDENRGSVLKAIWADATKDEQEDEVICPPGTRGHQGHVDRIFDNCTYYRGQASHQELLYPQFSRPHVPLEERELILKSVHRAARNVILDFGIRWVQVSGMNSINSKLMSFHRYNFSRIQFYKSTAKPNGLRLFVWWTRMLYLFFCVLSISSLQILQKRGFQVGIAFEFDKYVMAFLTMDLLICVSFFLSRIIRINICP